jgi:hypothetical protein
MGNGTPDEQRWMKFHEPQINRFFCCQHATQLGLGGVMRVLLFLLISLAVAAPVAAQRQSLGIFGQWGAFREAEANRCFAIAEPQPQRQILEWKPFASVGYWTGRRAKGQVHFRLSRMKRPGSALILRIDDRTFQLAGGGINAWAPDPRSDGEIVSAMRSGIAMSLETRSERGGLIRDSYQLRGAATAIDAAAIACAGRMN